MAYEFGQNVGFGNYLGGGGQSNDGIMQLLRMFGGGGQGGGGQGGLNLGATDALSLLGGPTGIGLNIGGKVLEGIGGLIGGPSAGEKRAEKTFNLAKNRLGQDVLDPSQYLADYMRSLAPQFNRDAAGVSARLGLDSGLAQQELASGRQSQISDFFFKGKMLNDQLKAQQDNMLLSLMAQLGG